jgi:hypothetical protein
MFKFFESNFFFAFELTSDVSAANPTIYAEENCSATLDKIS